MRLWSRTLLAVAVFRAAMGVLVLIALQFGLPGAPYLSITAFAAAQISDHLDGWIARRWAQPTLTGYLQDSVADKLFHAGCLLGLSAANAFVGLLFWGVLVREFVLLSLRVLLPHLKTETDRFRPYSIAYAAMLRGGIAVFLLTPFVTGTSWDGAATSAAYILVAGAVSFGLVALVGLLRSSPSGAPPRSPMARPARR
jgi:phosphatidylglycerophosphate synthase